jgi:hypothetical protein
MDRVREAEILLKNPIFIETFESLKTQIMLEWENTTAHATTDREQLWLELKVVDKIYNHIVSVFEEGQIHEHRNRLTEI